MASHRIRSKLSSSLLLPEYVSASRCSFGASVLTLSLDVAAHGGIIKSEYSILYGAVAFIFLVSGLQLSHEKLRENLTNLRLHIIVQGISFVLIPVIMLSLYFCNTTFPSMSTNKLDQSSSAS